MAFVALQVLDIPTAVVTLLCAMSLQVFSNLVNDYYDFVRGCDKAGRSGPQRPLAEGIVNEKQMRTACIIALSVALLLGAYLVWVGGWVILLVGVLSALFAWLYTATRFSLAYLGIADIICFLFYGPVASAGTVFLQCHEFSLAAFYAGCACGCIAVCVLASNNIRDIEDDRAVGKRTFPVRFGKTAALVGVQNVVAVGFVGSGSASICVAGKGRRQEVQQMSVPFCAARCGFRRGVRVDFFTIICEFFSKLLVSLKTLITFVPPC